MKANILEKQGYVYTAKWCRHISENLSDYADISELSNNLTDLIKTFKDEFLARTDFGNRDLRFKCLAVVQGILEWGIRAGPNLRQTLGEALPLLDRIVMASKPIDNVSTVLSELPENAEETRVYGSLFVFQLHLESQYFPMLRTLCAIKLTGDGENQAVEKAMDMDFADIKTCLGIEAEPLFEVYETDGRHLRNSIAHAQFSYSQGKLTCWDIDRSDKEVWRRELTTEQLGAIIFDIYSINQGYMFWFALRELIDQVTEQARKGFVKKAKK